MVRLLLLSGFHFLITFGGRDFCHPSLVLSFTSIWNVGVLCQVLTSPVPPSCILSFGRMSCKEVRITLYCMGSLDYVLTLDY
uniref:Uncharacterized protein n=1 Tax=Physcomitrium patens TaxID=3218 RepID=A0A7I3ZAA6_PHYPA